MKWAILTLNSQGIGMGMRLYEKSREKRAIEIDIYSNKSVNMEHVKLYEEPVSTFYKQMSPHYDAIIYIMAMGIIVRSIQPEDKRYDKPVICIQLRGEYVIPVIGGHLGGANAIAMQIAEDIGAEAVITTASDLCHLESVDMIAKKKGWYLKDMEGAKKVTADWVEGKPSLILSEMPLTGLDLDAAHIEVIYDRESSSWTERYGHIEASSLLMVTSRCHLTMEEIHAWKDRHVTLIPNNLVLGIGCRKGISYEQIQETIQRFMRREGYAEEAIGVIASIDLKREEVGIVQWAKQKGVPFVTYKAAELDAKMDGFVGSDFVRSVTGSRGVCMPAGYIASDYGKCLKEKYADNGVTLSLWKRR